jgi:FMN phosphatase YigB (HAD superfamily)
VIPSDPPRAVTVDLWHTLLYADPASRDATERARQAAWVRPLVAAGIAPAEAERAVHAMRRESEAVQATGRSAPLTRQARWLRDATGVPVPVDRAAETIRRAVLRARVHVPRGARGALDEFRTEGLRLALVSNILAEPADVMHTLLTRTRLGPRFRAVYLSAERRYAKPSPRPFWEALRACRVPPAEAVHIGDHSDDVVGALAAGLPVIRFTGLLTNYSPEPPAALARIPPGVPEFDRWTELGARWEELLGRARAVARTARRRPAMRRRRLRRGRSGRAG